STHAGRKRRSAAEDNAEVVIKPHLSGAIPRESDQWWGGGEDEERNYGQGDHSHTPARLTRCGAQPSASEQMEVKMVTKMVANRRQRVDIERDAPTRAVGFHNTNQHLSGQNKTDRNGHQQISSSVLSTMPAPANVSPDRGKSRGCADRGLQEARR